MGNVEDAWAAGLFEGEGSISIQRGLIRLTLGITDGDVLKRFAQVAGCGSVRVREEMRKAHWKSCWYWEVNKQDECVQMMSRLLPYLGQRRTARWAQVVAEREAYRPLTVCPACEETFKPVRRGQVCCGRVCALKHTRSVGKYSDRAPNKRTAEHGYSTRSSERRALGLIGKGK